jgi:hypothetical protein
VTVAKAVALARKARRLMPLLDSIADGTGEVDEPVKLNAGHSVLPLCNGRVALGRRAEFFAESPTLAETLPCKH